MSSKKKDHKKNPRQGKPAKRVVPVTGSTILGQSFWEKNPILPTLIILLITFIAFFPMLQNGFTNWDDPVYVTSNELIKDLSFNGIKAIFTTPVSSLYHPLTIFSLALNYGASGLNPFSYTMTNLILHLLNTLLVFGFIFRLTDKKLIPAIIVSLFFGIHPMHIESVAWITERKDLLYTFFLLCGLLTYLKYQEKQGMKYYLFTVMLFVLSLLSKPSAMIFPALLILIDYYQYKPLTVKKYILEKIPFGVLALAVIYITLQLQLVQNINETRFTSLEGILFGFYGFIIYIIKLFVPFNLSAFHPYPENTDLEAYFYLAPIVSLGIFYLTYRFRKNRALLFGLGFYLVAVLPNLKFFPYGNSLMADRYSYVSYIGLLFIIGNFIYRIINNKATIKGVKKIAIGTIVVATLAFMVQTHERTKIWNNSKVLWTDVVKKYPDSYRAHMSLGAVYVSEENYQKALEHLNRSLEINPTFTHSMEFRGMCYLKLQEYDLALTDLQQWKEDEPDNAEAYIYLAEAQNRLNKTQGAIAALDRAIELEPGNTIALGNRGTIYFNKLKNYEIALEDFNRAIELNPDYGLAYANRANCYLMLGDKEKARENAEKAIELGVSVPASFFDYLN